MYTPQHWFNYKAHCYQVGKHHFKQNMQSEASLDTVCTVPQPDVIILPSLVYVIGTYLSSLLHAKF